MILNKLTKLRKCLFSEKYNPDKLNPESGWCLRESNTDACGQCLLYINMSSVFVNKKVDVSKINHLPPD